MVKEIPEDIKIALEAAGESAKRSRWAILILVTASILAFMPYWNSKEHSWIRTRQTRLDAAVENWTAPPKSPEFISSKKFVDEKFQLGAFYGSSNSDGTNLLGDLKRLRDDIDDLQNHEVRYVRVAFFGIGFDVNDLGVFSGIGFSVLLIILAFSLKREVRNVKFFFELLMPKLDSTDKSTHETSNDKQLKQLGYNLLAMRQVLTLPMIAQDEDSHVNFAWKLLQWCPFVTPFIIQSAILADDISSFQAGQAWDPTKAILLVSYDSIGVVVVGLLTLVCILQRISMNTEWAGAYKEAFHQE